MAKRRHRGSDELLLIPFLDILCSLIGILILIIVVLCVAESQKANGRSPQELDQAQEYQKMLKLQKQQDAQDLSAQEKLKKLEETKKDLAEKEQKLARLRKLLAMSKETVASSQELTKELDDLLLQIDGFTKGETDLKKELAALNEEMKKRQPPAQKAAPAVMVQPGGSGLAQGSKVFFVEASGGKLAIYWDQKTKTTLSAAPEVIATDASYNYLLQQVAKVPNSKIMFLLRDDGMGTYNNAAGWAQATYGFTSDRLGKLPLPGRGEVNLQMFQNYLGTMPQPPPDAKPVIPAPPPKP